MKKIGLPLLLSTVMMVGSAGAQEAPLSEAKKTTVLDTIAAYIEGDIAVKDRFFLKDPRTGEPLSLAYDHVHTGVKPHGEHYLACVDFTDEQGTLYDVDVVVSLEGETPKVTTVFLHKVDGEKVSGGPQAK